MKYQVDKNALIAEYLTGDTTYRAMGEKHNIPWRRIHAWVTTYKKKHPMRAYRGKKNKYYKAEILPLPFDVKELREELKEARLEIELLDEMLRLSEKLTGIELRKKFGTKQ